MKKLKGLHSQAMSGVLAEADHKHLKQTRLYTMNLKRMPPNEKKKKLNKSFQSTHLEIIPSTDGLAVKAGKLFYLVRVGEPQNLYDCQEDDKTHPRFHESTIDLHGMTKEETQ